MPLMQKRRGQGMELGPSMKKRRDDRPRPCEFFMVMS